MRCRLRNPTTRLVKNVIVLSIREQPSIGLSSCQHGPGVSSKHLHLRSVVQRPIQPTNQPSIAWLVVNLVQLAAYRLPSSWSVFRPASLAVLRPRPLGRPESLLGRLLLYLHRELVPEDRHLDA